MKRKPSGYGAVVRASILNPGTPGSIPSYGVFAGFFQMRVNPLGN